MTFDGQGRCLETNRHGLSIIGIEENEVLNKKLSEILSGDQSIIESKIAEVLLRRQVDFESKQICSNGKEIIWQATLSPIDEREGFIGVFVDITERKQAEIELQRQSRMQELLMNMSTTYINLPLEKVESATCDSLKEIGEFVEADRAYIFDYDFRKQITNATHEWCGEGVEALLATYQGIPLSAVPVWALKRHRRSEPIWIADALSMPPSGLRDIIERAGAKSQLTVPLLHSGECLGFVGFTWAKQHHMLADYEQRLLTLFSSMLVNIRQRKLAEEEKVKIEEQLRQSQKMESIGTMAGGIAHDFNNILNVIYGYSQLAILDADDPVLSRQNFEQVLLATGRATELVKQILTFSRRKEQEKQPLQVALVIKEALKLLRSSIPTTIEIKQDITSNGVVLADPTQIHQICMNLCTNAYHAMRATGGILAVSISELDIKREDESLGERVPGRYLHLEVSDTGCGISPEIQDKIFEPYFTTKSTGEGTGLGLAVVQGIVESHNGHITVHSEPGKGTTFHVYLPVVTEKAVELPRKEVIADLNGHGERILFVDDEAQFRECADKILSLHGYEVTTCSNGVQALEEFQKHPGQFDIVITDMTMPYMTGALLAQNILGMRPELPIILCTGGNELITREGSSAMGIGYYLTKPLDIDTFLSTLRKALQKNVPPTPAGLNWVLPAYT